ncbi:MAG: hypothetical protein CM1200mP29_02490 [Verrucomicrobiota bacterium]|nr:MAG: hypothetical protein CM1200mP29_02490 [Verrucomicrobiota bacterium]
MAGRTVFRMSIAIVIGPTPPGFGVILPAIGCTAVSPRPNKSVALFGGGIIDAIHPTSITVAPGLTISALMNSAMPIAATKCPPGGNAPPHCGCESGKG